MPGKWDGKSRISNDLYRKRHDEIFKPKTLHEELMEGFKKEQEEFEKEVDKCKKKRKPKK